MRAHPPQLSIALATCNGSDYLAEQLNSIAKQTRPPDELVAYDDGSTDNTLETLEAFARQASFTVRIFHNRERIGPTANFARAIASCRGELVALSDQDDVWFPEKLARLEDCILKDSLVHGVFCNALIADERLRSRGTDMWDVVHLSGEARRQVERGDALPALLKRYRVQGATLLFRAKLVEAIVPIPDGWNHDAWIAIVAASMFRLQGVPICLQIYRQHQANVVGAGSNGLLKTMHRGWTSSRAAYYQEEIAKYSVLLDRLRETANVSDAALRLVLEKLSHLTTRATMPDALFSRCAAVIKEWRTGRYRRYATDWRSVALDLIKR